MSTDEGILCRSAQPPALVEEVSAVVEGAQSSGDISMQIGRSSSTSLGLSTGLTQSSAMGDEPEEDNDSAATCSEAGDEVGCVIPEEQHQQATVSEDGERHAAEHMSGPRQASTRFCTTGPSQSFEEVPAPGTLGHEAAEADGRELPLQPRLTSVLMLGAETLPRHIDESATGRAGPFSLRLPGITARAATDSVHSGALLPPAA